MSISDDEVEAAARALCIEDGRDPDSLDPLFCCDHENNAMPAWTWWSDHARAALSAAAKVHAIREGDGEVELRLALEAIERIIRENIRGNGTNIDRMNIGGEWHTGPVVDASFRILRGLQRIAAQAIAASPIPATGGEKE